MNLPASSLLVSFTACLVAELRIMDLVDFILSALGVKPLIHQSQLRTYAKVVPFKEKSSF